MHLRKTPGAGQVITLLGLGMSASLLGDATLYVVLPTQTAQAGILLTDVGLMLSANRAVRILISGPYGVFVERIPRRLMLVPSLLIGALSTLLYSIPGFWALLAGRILWGVAWAGIWTGGSAVVLDLAGDDNRGRLMGRFQMWFFIGAGGSALIGGLMTDWLGYRSVFGIFAAVNALGALLWGWLLPETRPTDDGSRPTEIAAPVAPFRRHFLPLATATALQGLNRFIFVGVIGSILPLLLQQRIGDAVLMAGLLIPLATFTGALSAANKAASLLTSPLAGWLSDRQGERWGLMVFGLALGVAALVAAADGAGATVVTATLLTAVTSSLLQTQVMTLAGDYGDANRQGRILGIFNIASDAGSTAGPLLAFALLPLIGIRGVCLASAALTALALPWTLWVARRAAHRVQPRAG
ncbi:MAG: MFS transporter [Anaerolineae bacterium]|nr:MFS transporter [Anaerolineae bacterium]